MEYIYNKCINGNCVHAEQGTNSMFCNSKYAKKEGRGKYIYPIAYESCDCHDYKKIMDGSHHKQINK